MIFSRTATLFLAVSLASAGLHAQTPPIPAAQPAPSLVLQPAAERSKALAALFAEMWQDRLEHSPEFASTIGDKRYNDRLDDYSAAAYNQQLQRETDYLAQLAAIDTAGLGEQEQLSKEIMLRHLIQDQQEAVFKPWQMPVNQFSGIQTSLPRLVGELTFTTVKDYDDYIARLGQVPNAFRQVTDDLEAGIADHRTPPRFLLEKVSAQTKTLATQKPDESPFARPVMHFPAGISAEDQARIKAAVLAAIEKQVLPAYARFARYLDSQYVPAGREDPGAWALPNGDAYYRFAVKQQTTTDLTPDQIHQIGLDEVARDEREMLAIAQKLGFPTIAALRASIAADPKRHPASREALLAVYRQYLDQMKPKLPQYFGRLPKAPLLVEAVPEYIEKEQAPAYYEQGTADGSRPGTIFINTYQFAQRSLPNTESIAYHEGLPGHHLQISIAQELPGLPEFRKYGSYNAFEEGWGLYSERLGKDMGFYQDPYSDFGRLETDVFRGVRLVVDTGVHSKHWTRQQMVDYFRAHSGLDEASVQSEVDRYIAWPAQALGYKMGQLKLLELRGKAQQALGPKFDYRTFHDEVLDSGAMPLDLLDERVTSWIGSQNKLQKAGK
jgi:uncharacterized protein (DUF885 family)